MCNGLITNSTSSYKYLDSVLCQSLSVAENIDKKFKKVTSRLELLRKLKQELQQLTTKAAYAIYNSVIIPVRKYDYVIQLNPNKTQLMKPKSFDRRANNIFQTITRVINSELEKHIVLSVKKCLNKKLSKISLLFSILFPQKSGRGMSSLKRK